MRVGDAFTADEIYAGRFPLAGRVLMTEGASPFELVPPSLDFARELHSFRWLRHLRAAGHELAFANGRALVGDWIRKCARGDHTVAWESEVVARRVIAWFSHAPVVLRNADTGFHRRFLKSLAAQVRFLKQVAASAPDGETRLRVRIAIAFASLVLPSARKVVRSAARHLDAEIARQILPDGSHLSRNPQAILDLLTDLLPLRQTYVNLGFGAPARLIPAIDRMFPALRFFRHTDGELGLFNGAGPAPAERLVSILRRDETAGEPFRHLPHGKYQRLSAGPTTVIADTGPPPPGQLSRQAHAGCLSFELSTGVHRLIVNSGVPIHGRDDYAAFARSTAAHSTVVLDNTSSARLSRSRFLGPLIVGGVRDVTTRMEDGEDGSRSFTAVHDGYLDRCGLYHERSLWLSGDGLTVRGCDRFFQRSGEAPGENEKREAVARFHVHPRVSVEYGESGAVRLLLPKGETWTFACRDAPPEIQDDIFFAEIAGPCRSRQIAVVFQVGATPAVRWSLSRA